MCKRRLPIFLLLIFSATTYGQKDSVDISSLTKFDTRNREITIIRNGANKPIVFLNSRPNNGVAWLNDVNFSFGTIEFDLKGKNLSQASFVGLAYHSLNDST